MAPRWLGSFQVRLVLAFALLIAGMGTAVCLAVLRLYERHEQAAFELGATSMASVLGASTANAIYELRFDQLRILLERVLQQPYVVYAYVYDADGRVLADGTRENRHFNLVPDDPVHRAAIGATAPFIQYVEGREGGGGRILDVAQPIVVAGDVRIGGVRLGLTTRPVEERLARAEGYALGAGLVVMVVGGLLSALIGRRLVAPIGELVRATRRAAAGDLQVRIARVGHDEIGLLAGSFNRMIEQLASQQGALEARIRERTRELEEANRQLEAASRHKSAFLANVSHELRTPLNAIIGFTRLVLRKAGPDLPPLQRENLGKVLTSGQQLLGLINGLLDLSKIEAGRMDVVPERFSIGEVVEQAAATVEPMLRDGRTRLVTEVAPGIPPLLTDRDKVLQILLNLLSNAVKFTDDGEISVRATADEQSLTLVVADTGCGIEAAALPYIFEEFRQAGTTRRGRPVGTGLGLAIVKRLAHLLDGSVRVESEVGRGSRFFVTIPLVWPGNDRDAGRPAA